MKFFLKGWDPLLARICVEIARICVEIDLDQPLMSHISVRGMKFCLEYEGLHSICFRCAKYGHKEDGCRELLEVKEKTREHFVVNKVEAVQDVQMTGLPTETQTNVQEQSAPNDKKQETLELGVWNIPKYVARKKKNNAVTNPKKPNPNPMPPNTSSRGTKPTQVEVVEAHKATGSEELGHQIENQKVISTINEASNSPSTKNTIKERVRNPLGGKNPQLSVKGKKVSKNNKPLIRKDNGLTKDVRSSKAMESEPGVVKDNIVGKENIPSTSKPNDTSNDNKAEEEAVMEYMKSMYRTHGENLLNKFRNLEPIRSALSHIDQNDQN